MEVLFMNAPRNPFVPEPVKRSFYCPTTPRTLNQDEKKVFLSPSRPLPRPLSPREQHWDVGLVPGMSADGTSPSSSKFDESWPSTDGGSPGGGGAGGGGGGGSLGGGGAGGGGGGECPADSSTLAKYIHRFRNAPPTSRTDRPRSDDSFWWHKEQDHTHPPHPPELTPPRVPQGQSTLTSSGGKGREGEGEATPPISLRLRVSSDGSDSLQDRAQTIIDKSSSLLTSSSLSSLPAQKYLNTRQPGDHASPDRGPAPPRPHLPMALRGPPLDPEGDILHQWRLRRRLEEAQKEARAMAEEGKVYPGGSRGGEWQYFGRGISAGGEQDGGFGGFREAEIRPQRQPNFQRLRDSSKRPHQTQAAAPGESDNNLTLQYQQPSKSHGSTSISLVPPALHHPHLYTPSPHTLHPHTHMACDIVPCPCCATEQPPPARAKKRKRPAVAAAVHGGRTHGNGPAQPFHATRSSQHISDGVEPATHPGTKLPGTEVPAQEDESTINTPRSVPLAMPQGSEMPSGNHGIGPTGTCISSCTTQAATELKDPPVSRLDGSLPTGAPITASGEGGICPEASKDDRPPVRYPSPSLLARMRTRRPRGQMPSGSEDEGPREGDEWGESEHSLTFSSEGGPSLTPLKATSPHVREPNGSETQREVETDVSIGAIVSETVERHLFGTSPHPPPPSPTDPLPAGQPTSKRLEGDLQPKQELLSSEATVADGLLNALIKKAKSFEIQLCEIDRLLSALGDD